MTHYIINLLINNLFCFKGRASRKEYIYRVFFIIFLFFINRDLGRYNTHPISGYLLSLEWLLLILLFIYILQYFPLAIRRLHDLNSSGWFVLISFMPFGQLLILWLMFKKGTDGVNDYGEPPEY
jgi:uncharacterized membrane protein YhaH (DUF805 family)